MAKKQYPYPSGDGIVKWVSTTWLVDHLDDDNLMVIDAQPNVHDYIQEHIPHAVYMNEGLLRVSLHGQPAFFVPIESIQPIFRRLGLKASNPVVVYSGKGVFKGWGDGLEQTMVAYALARFGLNHIYLLDGGLDKWKKENRSLTKEYPYTEDSDFEVNTRCEYWVDYNEFLKLKERSDTVVYDARPPAFYEGQGPWSKPGHIPGAYNLPWTSLMDDANKTLLKPNDEICQILEMKEITPKKMILIYCGTGREATNEFLFFKWYMKYPRVRLYEGSFTEWVSHPQNPTVTGKFPS
jgi:thiosulfate/3-mercaptopyruvate sulfurtransferase